MKKVENDSQAHHGQKWVRNSTSHIGTLQADKKPYDSRRLYEDGAAVWP
jgi:hypothetical protein